MGYAFGALKDLLADWVGTKTTDPRWSDATRGILINNAVGYLSRLLDTRYNEATVQLSTVAGVKNTAGPLDYSRPLNCWYLSPDTNSRQDVFFLPKDTFDQMYPDDSKQDDPKNFTVWGTFALGSQPVIQFGKVPKRVLTINLNYYSIPADLTDNAQTNAWLTIAWQPVFFRALAMSAPYLVEDDRIDTWSAEAQRWENRLVIEQAAARSTGMVPQAVEAH